VVVIGERLRESVRAGFERAAARSRYWTPERVRRVLDPEVQRAAARVVDALALALDAGDVADLLWAARELELRRARRNWLRVVCLYVEPIPGDTLAERAAELRVLLEGVDARAARLEPGEVVGLLGRFGRPGGPRTPARIAARLAAECGAFGYESEEAARCAFARLDAVEMRVSSVGGGR
jgi:hypothetical protein